MQGLAQYILVYSEGENRWGRQEIQLRSHNVIRVAASNRKLVGLSPLRWHNVM